MTKEQLEAAYNVTQIQSDTQTPSEVLEFVIKYVNDNLEDLTQFMQGALNDGGTAKQVMTTCLCSMFMRGLSIGEVAGKNEALREMIEGDS